MLVRHGGQHLQRPIAQRSTKGSLQRLDFRIELPDLFANALGLAGRARGEQHQSRGLHIERRQDGITGYIGWQRHRAGQLPCRACQAGQQRFGGG